MSELLINTKLGYIIFEGGGDYSRKYGTCIVFIVRRLLLKMPCFLRVPPWTLSEIGSVVERPLPRGQ